VRHVLGEPLLEKGARFLGKVLAGLLASARRR
jgi:hypothetical protein